MGKNSGRLLGIREKLIKRILLRKAACCSLLPTGNVVTHVTIGQGGTFRILREHNCRTARGEMLLSKIGFSCEAKFHLCDNVKRHDIGVRGSEKSSRVLKHVRDITKINVFVL